MKTLIIASLILLALFCISNCTVDTYKKHQFEKCIEADFSDFACDSCYFAIYGEHLNY